jgi:hypothetical protein
MNNWKHIPSTDKGSTYDIFFQGRSYMGVNLLESHSCQMIKGMAFPQTIQHDEHRCLGGRLARGLTWSPKHGKAIVIVGC